MQKQGARGRQQINRKIQNKPRHYLGHTCHTSSHARTPSLCLSHGPSSHPIPAKHCILDGTNMWNQFWPPPRHAEHADANLSNGIVVWRLSVKCRWWVDETKEKTEGGWSHHDPPPAIIRPACIMSDRETDSDATTIILCVYTTGA